jgi:transposase InsO family protein
MCLLAAVSRASYYRHCGPEPSEDEEESRLRDAARLMRADNLLAIRKRKFVATTHSQHDLEVAVNVARRFTPTALNQLWVADITYVRLGRADVFLAVVMDAFSRKIIGWNLCRSLVAELPLQALRDAIEARCPAPGLIHHSDRGVQYACSAYVDTLLEHGIVPSMSRPVSRES